MCFGKKEKPQPSASQQEKSGPRPARNSPPAGQPRAPSPPRASQPQASDQRPASRRQSRSGRPVTQEQNHTDSQPREGRPRRARSQDRARSLDRTDRRRASGRLSGLDHSAAAPQGVTPDPGRGILIAVMGITGKTQAYSKPTLIG